MKQSRVVCFRFAALIFGFLSLGLVAWASVSAIRQPIDESSLVTLGGNVHPMARAQYDRGAVDASMAAGRMLLVLKRSATEDADLDQFLGQLHDKKSANYRKWLTPSQFGDRFGASPADVETLTAWLQGHGFKVDKVDAARMSIEFSGSVGQLQQTFHTSFHRYLIGGQEHVANATDPKIPAALAPVVAGLAGMNDFFPVAQHSTPVRASYDRATHKATAEATAETTTATGGNLLYVGPQDAATIYDAPNSLNAKFAGGQPVTGSGVTIGVVSDANINTADVDNYRSFFGLPANTPKVVIDGGTDPGVDAFTTGHTQQALLDVEVAGALAPNATVVLYTAKDMTLTPGLTLAIQRSLNDNLVDILQVGFSVCEAALTNAGNRAINNQWTQAAAQGVSVVVETGDSGAAGCDLATTETSAQGGLRVNAYASTPNNIAVGGTDFDTLAANFSTYVSAGGTALGYIPESPFNNSVALGGNSALANNTAYRDGAGATNIFAGGGGPSNCVNGVAGAGGAITCLPKVAGGTVYGYGQPSWQFAGHNQNIPLDGLRHIPDVAMLAGTGQYGAAWAVCGNDYDAAGNAVADCAPGSGNVATIQGIGGTSAAASAFAGVLALVSQSQFAHNQTYRLGQANFVIYDLANQTSISASVFHDVPAGNNSVVCTAGSLNCGTNGFLTGYDAGVGYDQATGLGSVDATQLAAYWTSNGIFDPTTTVLTVNGATSPVTVPHGTPLTFAVTVTGDATYGPPTGLGAVVANVDETNNTYGDNVGFAQNLTNGTTSATSPQAPGGTYTVTGRYSGDLNYAASSSTPVQLIIAKEDSILYRYLYQQNKQPATAATYVYGTYLSVDARPLGVSQMNGNSTGIATGTVMFSDNGVPLSTNVANNLNNNGIAEVPNYYWQAGPHSITATYGGDNSFNPSATTNALIFSVGQAATGLTLVATPASLISGTTTITGTVAPNPANLGLAPTGTVTLTDAANGTVLVSPSLIAGKDPVTGGSVGTFTLVVPADAFALGANVLNGAYSGDTNYIASTGTVTVTRLVQVATTLTVTATPASLLNGTTTVSGVIAASAATAGVAPSGSITLTDSTNGAALGTAVLVAGANVGGNPTATFTLTVNATSLALGANTLSAAYPGDVNYSGSMGTTVVTRLAPAATTVTLSANPATLATGTTLVSGQVTPATAGVTPTGTITLTDTTNGAALGSPTLVAGSGGATFSIAVNATALTAGANTLTAVYSGDATYAGSSGTTIVTLTTGPPPPSDFAITAMPVTIAQPGQAGGNTSVVTVTPISGFVGQVNLTAALTSSPVGALGLPTIALSAPSVSITGNSPATVTATITTTRLQYALQRPTETTPGWERWSAGGTALACVLLFGIPARRRGWKAMLGLLLFAAVGLSVGCGISLNKLISDATSPGTYMFTITGTDQASGKITASGTLQVTVK